MSFHKKVKFPFEVTKGKSKDLYKLRFLRKSELEPSVRHSMRHNVKQTEKQLDIWYKEQLFTIGALTKDQEKVLQSRKRLRKEQRQIKKQEYARKQDEIRKKLLKLRKTMIMMKVVQKFKDNVQMNKDYRMKEYTKRGKVDFLRIPGNEHSMSVDKDARTLLKTTETQVVKRKNIQSSNQVDSEDKFTERKRYQRKSKLITPDTEKKVITPDTEKKVINSKSTKTKSKSNTEYTDKTISNDGEEPSTANEENDTATIRTNNALKQNDQDSTEYDSDENSIDSPTNDEVIDPLFEQRYPSSHGPRMETIPEEGNEDVELEIDYEEDGDTRLTKRRLQLLNRSHSSRNIFDSNEQVPLLPDVTSGYTSYSHKPDTTDKETQTSNDSRERRKSNRAHNRQSITEDDFVKKSLVVKLPRSGKPHMPLPLISPKLHNSLISIESCNGNYGSGSDDGFDYDATETDVALGDDLDEFDLSATDGWESGSEEESSSEVFYPGEASFTLTNYKSNTRRATDHSSDNYKTHRDIKAHVHNFPDETELTDIQSLQTLYNQNPYSLQFKERSFFLKSDLSDRTIGSARTDRSRHFETGPYANEATELGGNREPEYLKEFKNSGLEDIRTQMARDYHMLNLAHSQNLAVLGKKADQTSKEGRAPPNSPMVPNAGNSSTRTHKAHLAVLLNQKREQAEERKRLHDLVSNEPVQKYERTRSGRLLPFGTPRISRHEIPSMKDVYYRDKMLKSEREKIFNQNIKMRRFMNTFDKERDRTIFPPIANSTTVRTETSTNGNKRKTIGNLLFKVHEPEQDMDYNKKIVPSVSNTSLRLLQNCRYLRQYTPMTDKEREGSLVEKETSWKMKTSTSYSDNYIANVRLHLF